MSPPHSSFVYLVYFVVKIFAFFAATISTCRVLFRFNRLDRVDCLLDLLLSHLLDLLLGQAVVSYPDH